MSDVTGKSAVDKSDIKDQLPLGKHSEYVDTYTPELLCPIPRKLSRDNLGIEGNDLPFKGVDVWNAYELSWLNTRGKPEVAMAQFFFPCESESIIESKSFKLYLNSFNQSRFDNVDKVCETLIADLTNASGSCVEVTMVAGRDLDEIKLGAPTGECIDNIDINIDEYQPDPALLTTDETLETQEALYSHLFRSLCPVTGQPDWGSVHIRYKGHAIDKQGLLAYLVGFRQHQDFHEQCVERIYLDILECCKPSELAVCAYFVRRGGLDINPYRSTTPNDLPVASTQGQSIIRLSRQ